MVTRLTSLASGFRRRFAGGVGAPSVAGRFVVLSVADVDASLSTLGGRCSGARLSLSTSAFRIISL